MGGGGDIIFSENIYPWISRLTYEKYPPLTPGWDLTGFVEYNLDYLHGVNFHKGCYIGQELTARKEI